MPLHGLIAEFRDPDALVAAANAVRGAGYSRMDAYSPFPLSDLEKPLALDTRAIPIAATVAAVIGAAITYFVQYWTNAVDYPFNVGGRPLHSWPAFIPATIIVATLWSTLAALIGMLLLCRLPRLHHPVFDVPGFERATEDRFFLLVECADPKFDPDDTRRLLEGQQPVAVREVPA